MSKKQATTNNKQQKQSAAAGAEAFTTDEAVMRVVEADTNDAAATAASLYSDLAYWQTRAFDLQNEITSLEDQRKQRQMQSLDKIKQTLRAA